MTATAPSTPPAFRVQRRSFPPAEGAPSSDFPLGIAGFRYPDLFDPAKLRDLFDAWCKDLAKSAPDAWKSYEAYRACQGAGMTPEQVSEVLLAVAPHVSAFVGRLFRVEKEMAHLAGEVKDRSPLWRFKQDFAKKRVLKDSAGKSWTGTFAEAAAVSTAAKQAATSPRSAGIAMAGQPPVVSEAATSASASALRSTSASPAAPRSANNRAVASPIPCAAPVTSMTRPANDDASVTPISSQLRAIVGAGPMG